MLSDEKLGQMIRRLRSHSSGGGRYTYNWETGHGTWTRPKPLHTDKEIAEALNITVAKLNKIAATTPFREWDRDKIVKAVIGFYKKNGRWPHSREYQRGTVKAGIPAWSTLQVWFGTSAGRGRFWERFGGHDAMFMYMVETDKWFKKLTPEMIMAIRNVTTRRAAMEKYGGAEAMLKKGGGTEIQRDDYGILWEMPSDNSQETRTLYVEVVNSTPEPDGSYAHYFLRVPPGITTARGGVAWGFEMEADQLAGFTVET